MHQCLKGGYKEKEDRLFSAVCGGRISGNGHKLKHKLNMRKYFFHCEGDQAQAQVARRGWEAPSLEILKKHLETVLGNKPDQGRWTK